jgi:hypothetical protein
MSPKKRPKCQRDDDEQARFHLEEISTHIRALELLPTRNADEAKFLRTVGGNLMTLYVRRGGQRH